jgi:hypothetical protein
METIEGLDKLIRTRLIEKRGNVKLAENKDIVLYGKELGITENQLLFKILDISETIDWSEVEKNNTQENYNFQTTNNDNTDIQQPVTNSIQCSSCNAINEKGIANYCVECGAELKIQPEPKTISEPTPDSNQNNYSTTQEKTKSKTPMIIGCYNCFNCRIFLVG